MTSADGLACGTDSESLYMERIYHHHSNSVRKAFLR